MRELQEQMKNNAKIIVERMKNDPVFRDKFKSEPEAALAEMTDIEIPDNMLDLTIACARQEFVKSIIG